MNWRLLIPWFTVLSCTATAVFPQSLQNDGWDSVLESLLSDEDLSSYAREELSLMYESMHEMPLNINTATREELAQLPFLSFRQIEDIHAYIYMHGPMLTLGELQLTGSLDVSTRQMLRHFIYAGDPPVKREKMRLDDLLLYGRNEVVTGMDIPLYMREGFRNHSPEELERYPNRAYIGNRLSHSLRYSFNWHNRIRFGITADKDAGEAFFGRNRAGYDFWSPYLYIKDMGWLKELAVGNFKAQFGYGLLLGGGFSTGKSMALSSMERNTQGVKPHSSTQEYGYLRGVGVSVGWNHFTYTLLAASTQIDATLDGDTLISSFKEDGYHRTELEWSKKHNSTFRTYAANVRYSYRGVRFGVTALAERLSLKYKGRDSFKGISMDGSLHRPRYALSAEISVLDSKVALLASQTFRFQSDWTMNAVLRHYSPGYMALHSNAVAEGGVGNETGLLTGFSHGIRNLKLSGYLDLFMHPEPKYGVSERSNGMDLRMEGDWRLGRRDNLYATVRFKSKQKDCKYTEQPEYCITERYRLRWTHRLRSGGELKTQLFYSRYDFIAEPVSNGWAWTETYSRSMFKERVDMSLTAAAFCTESYDSRISVYENGLRYAYNFISLYGRGARLSATIICRLGDGMQLNLKAGGIYYLDRDEISSAQQRIASCHKEDISVQFIAKF
ncbi:MAG: helix-hairpin-helix domain-containing protein [Bacteroidaceae bacterium]|nr:helix-hairpin-helix domain-containing protein [Bacteroidaceae bacterium]